MDPLHQFEIKHIVPIGKIFGHEIAFTNSALFMLIALIVITVSDARHDRVARAGARPAAVGHRNLLRVHRQHAAQHRRQRGDEVLPARVHAVHVHPHGEHDRDDPLHLHGDEPHHHHGLARAAGLLHRGHLRLLEERPALLQAVRAERNSDLHPAAGDVHRGGVVSVAADSPTACGCSPTCWAATSRSRCSAASSPCWAALGFLGWLGAALPLALTVALMALEFLVAFLQAYVFAILTCIYLNDAIHPGH